MCNIEECQLLKLKSDLALVPTETLTDEDKEQLKFNSVDWNNSQFDLSKLLCLSRFNVLDDAVLGRLYLRGVFLCYTLEKKSKMIPEARYNMAITLSPKFKGYYPEIFVPKRSGIRIHKGNSIRDTSGCILVGSSYVGSLLYHSSEAFNLLYLNIDSLGINQILINNQF